MPIRTSIGIDFGTSNTYSAFIRDGDSGDPQYTSINGKERIPTVVAYDKHEKYQSFGQGALDYIDRTEYSVVSKFKLWFLDKRREPEAERATINFLRALKGRIDVQANLGGLTEQYQSTVVGYPSDFGTAERNQVIRCAKEAGFYNVQGLEEPVAAVLYFVHKRQLVPEQAIGRPFLVLDLGSGTSDACLGILQSDRTWSNKGNAGTNEAGSAIDALLMKHFSGAVLRKLGVEKMDKVLEREYSDEIRRFKERFSEKTAEGEEFFKHRIVVGNAVIRIELDKMKFETIAKRYVEPAFFDDIITRACKEANLSKKEIEGVVLTGGSSQWYFVRSNVSKIFGKQKPGFILTSARPEATVASGLCLYGAGMIDLVSRSRETISISLSAKQHSNPTSYSSDKITRLLNEGVKLPTQGETDFKEEQYPSSTYPVVDGKLNIIKGNTLRVYRLDLQSLNDKIAQTYQEIGTDGTVPTEEEVE